MGPVLTFEVEKRAGNAWMSRAKVKTARIRDRGRMCDVFIVVLIGKRGWR